MRHSNTSTALNVHHLCHVNVSYDTDGHGTGHPAALRQDRSPHPLPPVSSLKTFAYYPLGRCTPRHLRRDANIGYGCNWEHGGMPVIVEYPQVYLWVLS